MHKHGRALSLIILIIGDLVGSMQKVCADFEEWKKIRTNVKWKNNTAPVPTEDYEIIISDDLADYQAMEQDGSESPPVDVYISEVNLDSSSRTHGQYIELYVEDYKKDLTSFTKKLAGFRLLVVRGSPLEVVLSVHLSDFIVNKPTTFIVIGDENVPNLSIDAADAKFQKSHDGLFQSMDASPFAVIICYSQEPVFHDLLTMKTSFRHYSAIPLDGNEYLKRLIFQVSMDAIIVGRKAPTNQCDYFSSFFPAIMMSPHKKYILRDWDSTSEPTTDYSINYCSAGWTPFSPSSFKLGDETPGLDNDCRKRMFILEFEISRMMLEDDDNLSIEESLEGCQPDFPGVSSQKYAKIKERDYSNAVRQVLSSSSCMTSDYSSSDLMDSVNVPPPSQQPHPEIANALHNYINDFDQQSFTKCKRHFSNYLEVLTPQYRKWVHVDSSQNCLIKCRFCQAYFAAGWRVDRKSRSNLQKQGFHSEDPSTNQRAIRDHLKNTIHKEATEFYEKLKNAPTRAEQLEIEAGQRKYEIELFRPTMNEVQLGYTELRSRTSFRSHKMFMDTISHLGVNVGTKHRHDGALQQITATLSTSFHRRLLKYLVKNNKWFSIICDGTCNRQIPYFVCLFQSVEENRPMVFFWRLLTLSEGEKGENMVEDIKSKIEEDNQIVPGFKEYFKSKVVASVSDGASNMVGNKNSFYTHLQDYAGRDLVLVKCLPHRLQRAVIHAINFPTDTRSNKVHETDRKRYFKSFSKINNLVYTFYMSRGSKRFQNLVELGEELDIPTYRINYFFDIRWAASHKRCMHTLFKNYDVIRADLEKITSDPSFDDAAKSKAMELKNHFGDKAFPVVVAEFVDLLGVIEKMSKRFQQKGGIMVGNVNIIKDGYEQLETLKSSQGNFLSTFLSKCSCPRVCRIGLCTLRQYDDCSVVHRERGQNLQTRTDGVHTIQLSSFRGTLYDNMQQQLKAYFEFEKMEAFEVFNHHYFRKPCDADDKLTCDLLSDCYITLPSITSTSTIRSPDDKLVFICKYYSMQDCNALTQQWKLLLSRLIDDYSPKSAALDPVDFWAFQLGQTPIVIDSRIRDILERIMATAFTSADAERAFSMVSSIKTPERASLSPSTLESLVRVQFNGPNVLSEPRLFEYTKEYIKVASRVDDHSQIGGRPLKSDSTKSFTTKSGIF